VFQQKDKKVSLPPLCHLENKKAYRDCNPHARASRKLTSCI
jgi:hypothetical protein